MHTLLRAAAVAVTLLVASLGVVAPANAATAAPEPTYDCQQTKGGYGAPSICQLEVAASAICIGTVPYLHYALTPIGTPNTTATLTWANPDGADVVLSGVPLSGDVLWPGAVADENGAATDWPGWTQSSDGTWVQGDAFDWATGAVDLTFAVNPVATVKVQYPSPNAACWGPTRSVVLAAGDRTAVLSATGSNSAPVLIGGAGLVGLGVLLLLVRGLARSRKATSS